ncbi:BRCT domain-containing protein [Marichromatium purpuratum]|uniref:BRCT domain-containing protein n=1 Tax=Marichromatium purpuratum TaxID=37487 RepID=UPI00021E618D|nr:BRCT domain-containing protein [Marichromatium purpuratum]
MDLKTLDRFNRKAICDRQIDTLIGLSKGLIADGRINQEEADFLHGWLIHNQSAAENPIVLNLFEKVSSMLEDGVLDDDESQELFSILQHFAGERPEVGELAKATSLPLDDPAPEIIIPGSSFLFTGTCAFGSRKKCHEATEALGGLIAKSVNKSLNFLVIGTYVTDSWAHESFGRKIEKAAEYRSQGIPVSIITESSWIEAAGL